MDLRAAIDALCVVFRNDPIRRIVNKWRVNATVENWYDPSSSSWKYKRAELPIVLNSEGEEISAEEQRSVWRMNLSLESDAKLINEDFAAARIIAAMIGYYERKQIKEIHRLENLSELEKYRYNECHGGC